MPPRGWPSSACRSWTSSAAALPAHRRTLEAGGQPGQRVRRGQMIAAADGFISTALHAPVTGTVEAIELRPHPNGQRCRRS